ncbi:MAG: permease [Phycisphaerae bacterium]|nr:MAG: permease [Phycisphaerae bacterium]
MSDVSCSSTSVRSGPSSGGLLALLVLLNLFNYIDRYNLPPVLAPIEREFQATGSQMGFLATGFLVVYMLTAPLFGWMADRYSRWALVGIGMLIQSLGTLGSGLAESYLVLLIARCVVGIGDAAYGPAAPTIISDLYPIEKRGRKLAWFYAAMPVGSAVGFAIGGGMRELTGSWRWGFYSIVPPMILLGIICLLIRDRRINRGVAQPVVHQKIRFKDYLSLSKNRSYLLNCLGMTLMTFAIGGVSFWMPYYLEEARGISKSASSIGFGLIVVIAGLSATLAGGYWGDRLKPRFSGSYFWVSGIGMLTAVPLIGLMLVTPFPACWVVIFLAVFVLFLNTGPSNTILANVTSPRIRASAFALNIFIIHALGDAISPPIIGWFKDRWSFDAAFLLLMGVVGLSGIVWCIGARYLLSDTWNEEPSQGIARNA